MGPMLLLCAIACGPKAPPSLAAPELLGCIERTLSERVPPPDITGCIVARLEAPGCSAAWAEGRATTPEGLTALAARCAPELCAELRGERPTLCDDPGAGHGSAFGVVLAAELFAARLGQLGADPGLVGRIAALLPTMMVITVVPADPPEASVDPAIEIVLTADGELTIDGRARTTAERTAAFEEAAECHTTAWVRADQAVLYQEVIAVIDALERAGFEQFGLQVEAQ